MSRLTRTQMDELIDFVCTYSTYRQEDEATIRWFLAEHAAYNTLIVLRDHKDDSIVAVCRWNVLLTGQDAFVMDLIIRPDYQNTGLIRRILLKALSMYPDIRYLIFERHERGKPFKKIPVIKFLKRRV